MRFLATATRSISIASLYFLSAILDIAENYDHKNIGIITHNGIIRLLLFHFPDIARIYRGDEDKKKDIANADIYEWEITDSKIADLKSLLKNTPAIWLWKTSF